MKFNGLELPQASIVSKENGKIKIINDPTIAYIEGDGIGPDIFKATKKVIDFAVDKAYSSNCKLNWYEIFAGEKAKENFDNYLPEDTIEAIKHIKVAIKGPLSTPVGGGIRSLNVALRQILDLYSCIRPVRHYKGVVSPMKNPGLMDVVIFRENTEDVYAGIEWASGSKESKKLIEFIKSEFNANIRPDSGIGIKPISEFGSKRLVNMAIQYAIDNNRKSVTLMHKGNIMKYTEGAFKTWGYEEANSSFGDKIITEEEHSSDSSKLLINDRIADNMFQQILTRTSEYDVIATMNLNGDYFSDACAAQVGGLGMAPGANIGDDIAIFEATHGTAPKYANLDKVNPGSMLLSAKMMLDHIGFNEAANLVEMALEKTIENKTVTYDLARQIDGSTEVSCSKFADKIIENMDSIAI